MYEVIPQPKGPQPKGSSTPGGTLAAVYTTVVGKVTLEDTDADESVHEWDGYPGGSLSWSADGASTLSRLVKATLLSQSPSTT